MATTSKRVKRASVEDLYKTCRTGDCPPDVKNKVEGTTLADTLLKIFSSVVYFGGLGIGTGSGSGGSTGYRPLNIPGDTVTGGGTRGGAIWGSGRVVRPSVPLDPVGPAEFIPVDTVDPNSSSIVPLLEGNEGLLPGPEIVTDTLDPVITAPDPISDVTSTGGHPSVITSSSDDVAIIEVHPPPPTQTRISYSDSSVSTPRSVHIQSSVIQGPEASNLNIFVDTNFSGDTIGLLEEIELEPLTSVQPFEVDDIVTPPRTSTPRDTFNRVFSRARDLYNRRVAQLQTRNPDFFARPSRAVVFQFENPAFDEDVTLTFEQDLNALEAAPDPDFQDVILLNRPRFSETAEGRIRLSRLGRRGTISTRSGTRIGQQVHFYYDFSTIDSADTIELATLGQHSGDASIIDAPAESSFINHLSIEDPVPDEELVDTLDESFENSHLLLTASNELGDTYTIPTFPPGAFAKVFVVDVGDGLFVATPAVHTPASSIRPTVPLEPAVPSITIDVVESNDYYLHPGHRRKKRKRSYYY